MRMRRKRKLTITCFAVLLFVSVIMGCMMFTSMAKDEGIHGTPYYKSVRIQEGDSLWKIASQYRAGSDMSVDEYVDHLKQMNGLKKDTIHSGQYLTVVYFE